MPLLDRKPRVAIFLSGSGTNAENLLESLNKEAFDSYQVVCLVTDAPERSRAHELAQRFNIHLIELDVREFYKTRGELRVSLMTERGREIREEWTATLRKMLKPYAIDFAILAGFELLSNITHDFPCLNVHPGDLTIEEKGKRILVGLHTVPIEAALLRGHSVLKSSVIIADPYTGNGGEMDSGFILGLSKGVPTTYDSLTFEAFKKLIEQRTEKRPVGGFKDEAERIARLNQNQLKINGDFTVLPKTVSAFARGEYAIGDSGELLYYYQDDWTPIKSVCFDGEHLVELIH